MNIIDEKILYCLADEASAPFEEGANPFPRTKEDNEFDLKVLECFDYSEKNMKHLEKIIADIEGGHANLVEHDLIED